MPSVSRLSVQITLPSIISHPPHFCILFRTTTASGYLIYTHFLCCFPLYVYIIMSLSSATVWIQLVPSILESTNYVSTSIHASSHKFSTRKGVNIVSVSSQDSTTTKKIRMDKTNSLDQHGVISPTTVKSTYRITFHIQLFKTTLSFQTS